MRSKKSAKVALLELDPQGSVADWTSRRDLEDPIVLSAMPGNLEAYLDHARKDRADGVVIDTPPHAGATIDTAIRAADLVAVPIRPGPFDINAASGTIQIMRETRTPELFVLSQVSASESEGDDTEAVLTELHPDVPVAKARLGHRKGFRQALISGQVITEFERPSSKAFGEITALFQQVKKQIS